MTSIASLGIKVTTDGVQQAASDLEKLGKAGDTAASGVQEASAAAQKSRSAFQSGTAPVKQYRDELSRLLGQIDPVTKKLQEMDDLEAKLRRFRQKGAIDTETYNEYAKKLDQSRVALARFSDTSGQASLTAKQLQQATRQLPMQFTDIFTGLATGQRPMQVFLQQGGQLKDTFGGIGPALRASATYLLGLVNPMTLAAGAALGLAVAWNANASALSDFNIALAQTGNYAGKSAQQLREMTGQLDTLDGVTRGGA